MEQLQTDVATITVSANILLIAGFLVPVPLLMLHIVEALVQAYIFGMLALIYIAGTIQSQEIRHPEQGEMNA